MKKEKFLNILGVVLFYLLIIFGVILVNARMEKVNNNNSIVEVAK